MKRFLIGVSLLAATAVFWHVARTGVGERHFYAIASDGQTMGYMAESVSPIGEGQAFPARLEFKAIMKQKVLGSDFDVTIHEKVRADPADGRLQTYTAEYRSGDQRFRVRTESDGRQVHWSSDVQGEPRTFALEADVALERAPGFSRQLLADFVQKGATRKTYRVFRHETGHIARLEHVNEGWEALRLAGGDYACIRLGVIDRAERHYSRLWLDRETGRMIKMATASFFDITLADASVKDRVVRVDRDQDILIPVSVPIPNYKQLDSMKVRARIRSNDPLLRPADLNAPGQQFEGSVAEGWIDGVFEISHARYHGADAPAFPPQWPPETRQRFRRALSTEPMIETEDEGIQRKARELTADATDLWDAAQRISRFVSRNVGYAIPGGSAVHTLQTRQGECGSHSRLFAALCRAVDIPTRMVVGYMMTPNRGGSFGQHAWNEVWMGEKVGWTALDTTAREEDYLDSGHIRLGYLPTFRAASFDILDYRAGSLSMGREPRLAVPMPWVSDRTWAYDVFHQERKVGSSRFLVRRDEAGWTCESAVNIGTDINLTTRFRLDEDGAPRRYAMNGRRAGKRFDVEGDFSQNGIVATGSIDGAAFARETPAADRLFLIDDLQPAVFGLIASALPEDATTLTPFRGYMIVAHEPAAMSIEPTGRDALTIGGAQRNCRTFDFRIGDSAFRLWLGQDNTAAQLLLKSERLRITLQSWPDGDSLPANKP